MFNSQTRFKKVSSKILLSVLLTHVLFVSWEGWEEKILQRAKHIKYSTRCWEDWQRTCFCLLFVLETYLSCSAIVMDRFYKQVPFWAICSVIFFLWTPFFPCYFSELFRDNMRTDVLFYARDWAYKTLDQCHLHFMEFFFFFASAQVLVLSLFTLAETVFFFFNCLWQLMAINTAPWEHPICSEVVLKYVSY